MAGFSEQRWLQFWEYYKGLPHQEKAVIELQRLIHNANPYLLSENATWVETWRGSNNPLKVKWQSQLDNRSGTGYRECFSSSCAMLAMYWGKVAHDDAYNSIRAQYGDSTSAEAQLAALRHLGLHANFATDGTPYHLEREIDQARPVAVGWLHRGDVSTPAGGGHWSVVIGYTTTHWIHNDPNGEARLVEGGYTDNTNGAGVHYSRRNWDPRWRVHGTGGWYLTASPLGQ